MAQRQSWTSVRLTTQTRAQLRHWAQTHAEEFARDWAPGVDGMHVAVDVIVRELLRRDAEHRARARRQAVRRRRARAASDAADQAG